MSNGSRHNLYLVAESTYGETPATPTLVNLPITGTSLALTKESFQSAILRADRQIADFRHGTKQVGNTIDFEFKYGDFDALLQAVLGGTWAPKATITATDISAASADNSYNDASNGFVTAGFEVGDHIVVTGFTGNVANNITRGVLTGVTAGKLTLAGADGNVIVDDAAGESVTITTLEQVLVTGTTRRSFSMFRHFSDIDSGDNPWHVFTGVEVNTFSLTCTPGGIVTGSFGVIGKDMVTDSDAPAGSTTQAAQTTRVFDAFSGVVSEGGSSLAVATEITLSLENGMEPRFVIGSDTTLRPSQGRSNLTGQVTAYFEDSTLLDKFINETPSSLEFSLVDANGNTYWFEIPRLIYSGGQPDVGDEGPITLPMPFQAVYDAATNTNLRVTRLPGA